MKRLIVTIYYRQPLFINSTLNIVKNFYSRYRIQLARLAASLAMFIAVGSVLLTGPDSLDYSVNIVLLRLAEVFNALLLAALFYAAIGLVIGRRLAWYVAIIVLVISVIWEYIQSLTFFNVPELIIFVTLLIVILTQRFYTRQSEAKASLSALRSALIITALLTLVGSVLGWLFALSRPYHPDFLTVLVTSLDHMYVLSRLFHPFHPAPNVGQIISNFMLFILGLTSYILVALALLKPLIDQFILTPVIHQKILKLLKQYGVSSDDFFKYFPDDKSYFFVPHVDGFIAYGVSRGVCIALADPIAKDEKDRSLLLEKFLDYAEKKGWLVSFLPVDEARLPLYSTYGFRHVKLGAHAIINPKIFAATTAKNKHFRYIQNKFAKQGYEASLHASPHSPTLLRQLHAISDEWLKKGNRKERRFAMGYFDESYLQSSQLFIVYDKHHMPQAFVSLPPSYSSHSVSFDLLRYRQTGPKDINAFLFLQLLLTLHAEGYAEFNMGLAPLSGLEVSSRFDERSLHIFYKYASRWFAFKGLYGFKNRFSPTWKSYYAVYQGNSMQVFRFAVELNQLMKYNKNNKDRKG